MPIDTQVHGKRAELYVFGELLSRGVVPYLPLVDISGVDALVRTPHGDVIALQIKSAGFNQRKHSRWFQVSQVEPRKDMFFALVEAPGGDLGDVWVLPATIYDAYASRPPQGSPRDLDLDSGTQRFGQPLREVLSGFRNRWELLTSYWELLTSYEEFKELLDRPEELEDVLAMHEALQSQEEPMLTLDEYEQRRKSKVKGGPG